MPNIFGMRNLTDDIIECFFNNMSRKEQDELLQELYNRGYKVEELAKQLGLNKHTIYARIKAHRGRSPALHA